MIAQHQSATNEHPTPAIVVDAARGLMGGAIDLDPASTTEFNREIGAKRIHTRRDDGLAQRWTGRVFLNPPGGVMLWKNGRWRARVGKGPGTSSAAVWWDKLVNEYLAGRVKQAVFVGFTLEVLRTCQGTARPVQNFARCYPRKRMAFGGDQPTNGNVVAWLPPRELGFAEVVAQLRQHFGHLGYCEGPGAR